jgi:glutathione S-transferase
MKLELHYAPRACSMVPLIGLLEAGADFDLHTMSLKRGQQKSDGYLAVNPKGKVPALVADGSVITENVAILVWLDRAFAGRRLLPQKPDDYIQALSLMAWCASGLHPPLTRTFRPERYCDLAGSADSVRALAMAEQRDNFTIVNRRLAGRAWTFDDWSVVDAYFFWVWRRYTFLQGDVAPFPAYQAHAERMMTRPSVIRALEIESAALQADA